MSLTLKKELCFPVVPVSQCRTYVMISHAHAVDLNAAPYDQQAVAQQPNRFAAEACHYLVPHGNYTPVEPSSCGLLVFRC